MNEAVDKSSSHVDSLKECARAAEDRINFLGRALREFQAEHQRLVEQNGAHEVTATKNNAALEAKICKRNALQEEINRMKDLMVYDGSLRVSLVGLEELCNAKTMEVDAI